MIPGGEVLLEAKDLFKVYRRGFGHRGEVRALDGVSIPDSAG